MYYAPRCYQSPDVFSRKSDDNGLFTRLKSTQLQDTVSLSDIKACKRHSVQTRAAFSVEDGQKDALTIVHCTAPRRIIVSGFTRMMESPNLLAAASLILDIIGFNQS
jgi:hypothetical protein